MVSDIALIQVFQVKSVETFGEKNLPHAWAKKVKLKQSKNGKK